MKYAEFAEKMTAEYNGKFPKSHIDIKPCSVVCTARFSNGEAQYAIRTPRTAMIAAARA